MLLTPAEETETHPQSSAPYDPPVVCLVIYEIWKIDKSYA